MTEALDRIEDVLQRRERGLSTVQAHQEITRLSKAHSDWTEEMCLSVFRGDGRFRLSISGNIGLSEWESVRVPTRAEIVRSCIDDGGGRVSIEAIQARIKATYGEAPDRVAIGALAHRFGAGLDGDAVARVDE